MMAITLIYILTKIKAYQVVSLSLGLSWYGTEKLGCYPGWQHKCGNYD